MGTRAVETGTRTWWGIARLAVLALPLAGCDDGRSGILPPTDIAIEAGHGTCPTCRIEFVPVVTLGDENGGDGALSGRPSAVARDTRGRYYVLASEDFPESPFVFGPDGEFLQHIGKVGEGPNEYRMPAELFLGSGDSIRVIDLVNNRTTVVDPGRYEEARTYQSAGFTWDALLLPDGRSVVNTEVQTRERAGFALHILSPEGEVLGSFDEYVRTGSELARFARQMQLSAGGESVWVVNHAYEYRLVEWTTEGEQLRTINPTSPWFVPYPDVVFLNPETAPSPYAVGVWQDPDDESVVWVIGEMADPEWALGLDGPISFGTEQAYTRRTYHEVHDGFIEAIDVSTGDILASARTDLSFLNVVEPGLVAIGNEDTTGWSYAQLYRVSISR